MQCQEPASRERQDSREAGPRRSEEVTRAILDKTD